MIAYLAGFGFAFNTVATNWEMLMPGKWSKGTALKKGYSEGDVKIDSKFGCLLQDQIISSYCIEAMIKTQCNSNFLGVSPQWFLAG